MIEHRMNEFREMRRKLQQLTDEESMAILQNATVFMTSPYPLL